MVLRLGIENIYILFNIFLLEYWMKSRLLKINDFIIYFKLKYVVEK